MSEKIMRYDSGDGDYRNWIVEESSFDSRYLGKCEAIFSQGNGYMGVRAALEERYAGERRGTFVAGTFNRFDECEVTELPNLPDVTHLALSFAGRRFDMGSGNLLRYSRALNLRTGEITRDLEWMAPDGGKVAMTFRRFVSRADEHITGTRVTVRPRTAELCVNIESGIDGQITNTGSQHFHEGGKRVYDGAFLEMVSQTTQSGVTAAIHTAHRILLDGVPVEAPALPVIERRYIGSKVETIVPLGGELVIEKISCVHTSRDLAYEGLDAGEAARRAAEDGLAAVRRAYEDGYERLFARSRASWASYWDRQDIRIEGDRSFDQLAVRFALYHLDVMTKKNDSRVGIGAKGLSGEGYKGHSFWDTEIFIFPHFLFTDPATARTLLEYRYKNLYGAYKKARENGFLGAMYPWESAWVDDGEVTPTFGGADVVTGRPIPILTGQLEQHVSADIAYAVWEYVQATGDGEFLESCGYEIITQTGRFWASRAEWNEARGRYEYNDVIGPDEYKEHVDNNAYTNYMARWNMALALRLIREMRERKPALYAKLDARLRLGETEREIGRVADRVYLPQPGPDGIIPQFDGYLSLREIDLAPYKNTDVVGTIYNDYNAEQMNTLMVSKQADLMVLFYLRDDLFDRETKRRNYAFYEAHTLHDSSLSKSTHCVLANDLGLGESAYHFFEGAASIDLGEKMKSSDMGIHSASMGGIWQGAVMGFGGVRLVGGSLRISPRLPEEWDRLAYPLVWRGSRLRVRVTRTEVAVENTGGEAVELVLADRPVRIPAGETRTVGIRGKENDD